MPDGAAVNEVERSRLLEMLPQLLDEGDILVAGGSLPGGVPEDFYLAVINTAREKGARVVLDTSREALRKSIDGKIYLLKPNMRELAQVSEGDIGNEERQVEAARRVVTKREVGFVLLSLGAAGALLVSGQGTLRIRTPTVSVESKVGAGDSMVAGTVCGMQRGYPIKEAVLPGVAAGAAAVMTPGSELCRPQDTFRLYEHLKTEYAGNDIGS